MSRAPKLRSAARRIVGAALAVAAIALSVGVPANAESTPIGVLVPIIADAGDGQLLSAELLATETAADGDWTLLVNAAKTHGVTVALDSRITASIAALGNNAPASAVAWRDALLALRPVMLPWGNADVWAYSSSTNAFSAQQFAGLAGVDSSELVIWPSGRVVAHDSVATSLSRGFTRMFVFDDQFVGGLSRSASDIAAVAVAPGSTELLSRAAEDIARATPAGGAIALPALPSELDAGRVAVLLTELERVTGSLGPVFPTAVLPSRTPRTEVPAPENLSQLMDAYAADENRAATIADDVPAFLSTRLRALTAVTSLLGKKDFDAAVTTFEKDTTWLASLVSISLATEYTVLSNTAEVPVSISNASLSTVTVTVAVRSTSGIVQVDAPTQTITIEPQSNSRIIVPMTAVANGRAVLVAQLFDSHGESIGQTVSFPIMVQTQWELVTVIVFFGGVIVIMTIGIIRTIRRRKTAA